MVQSVRLPANKFAEIAEQAGVPVSALIRGWVLHRLATEQGNLVAGGDRAVRR